MYRSEEDEKTGVFRFLAASKIEMVSASEALMGLSMNIRLPGLEDRQGLLQVPATVVGFEHDHIDLGEEVVDRTDDLDAVLLDLLGVARESCPRST